MHIEYWNNNQPKETCSKKWLLHASLAGFNGIWKAIASPIHLSERGWNNSEWFFFKVGAENKLSDSSNQLESLQENMPLLKPVDEPCCRLVKSGNTQCERVLSIQNNHENSYNMILLLVLSRSRGHQRSIYLLPRAKILEAVKLG